jgi:Uma2 family endonuclease
MNTATLQEPIQAMTDIAITDDELYEVVDGKRVRQSPMAVYSVLIGTTLVTFLSSFVRLHNLGRTLQEALFHLPAPIGRSRRPDLAFVSYQRWAKTRPMPRTDDAWDVVPNLAVEVVSLTNEASKLVDKIAEYFRAGVELVWVVYPQQSQIYVYRSPTQITGLGMSDVLDGGDVVPGFRLPLVELFSEPEEETADPALSR